MTPKQLNKWRKEQGLSQSELAQRLRVSPNTVARWERDEMDFPPYLELALKAIAAGLTFETKKT